MNKSLLRILKAEDDILNSISGCEYNIAVFRSELDRIIHIPFECDAKQTDIECYERIIARETEKMEQSQRELESVRSEMRDYFAMLFEKGGENNG